MATTVLRPPSVTSADSELTLVGQLAPLSVNEASVDLTQAAQRSAHVYDDANSSALVAPTELAPQLNDVGWFELDENVVKGACRFRPALGRDQTVDPWTASTTRT